MRRRFLRRAVGATMLERPTFRRRPRGRGLFIPLICLTTALAESGHAQTLERSSTGAPAYFQTPITPDAGSLNLAPTPAFEAEQTSYADTQAAAAAGAPPPPTTEEAIAELKRRLGDVEGELKKRDEADKKAAAKKAAEEFPSHKITGFTQLDTAFYSQDARNEATVGNAQNGTGFRRARPPCP